MFIAKETKKSIAIEGIPKMGESLGRDPPGDESAELILGGSRWNSVQFKKTSVGSSTRTELF